jgi:site-specific recombinase XerD
LRAVIRRQHLAHTTEESYVGWLRRYARFVSERSPEGTPELKMERFLTQLAQHDCSASSQNQAFNALLYFYRHALGVTLGKVDSLRAKRPEYVRTPPEVHEVKALLEKVEDVGGYPTRLIVRMIYGMGLRVSEPLNIRVKDLLISESRLILRGAKGGKDRVVALPCSLVGEIKTQLAYARGVWERDQAARLPVQLPGLLAAKYPHWRFAWKWAWLFPALRPCADPRSGATVRWRCLEVNVQRCVRASARPLGLDITPHHLRHAYATHSLNRGVNVKALQAAMGHAQVETTIGYCHAEACSVPSPLEFA